MAKDALVERIVGLLDADRVEVRCAAAKVLGAAGRGHAEIGKALARKLDDPSPMMKRFVLDALEEMGARGLSAHLAPLLGSSDDDVKQKALKLLAAQGAHAEGALARELRSGTPAQKRAAAGMLVKSHSAAAMDALLEALGDEHAGEHVLQLLRAEIDRGDATLRSLVEKRAAAGARALAKKADPRHLGILLRILGYLADASHLPLLVEQAQKKRPPAVRLAAIAAMRRVVAQAPKGTEKAILALVGWADDPDHAVAQAAVDTLRGARVPEKLVKKFAALAKAKNPEARKLALERMPALGAASGIATLIQNLTGADPGLRDAAQRALQSAPEAAGPMVKALAEATEEHVARRLGQVLRAHEGRIPAAAIDHLTKRTAARLDGRGDRAAGALLEALSHLAPDAHAELLFERAARLRRSGRHAEAFASLRPLAHGAARLNDDQRFFLGVLGLKVAGKDLLRAARGVDPVLMQFAQLVGTGYPLAKALVKQKDVELDDLFTLGFNFVESHDEDEKDLGRELLETIVARQPRGKLAVAAKNKLKLSGGL
jgi:hypothetical protein